MLKALELASQVIMYLATQTVLYSNNTDVFVEEAPLLEHSPCVSWSRWYNLLVWDEECHHPCGILLSGGSVCVCNHHASTESVP